MTDEELDRLECLWKQGVKMADIADMLGYCERTLRYWKHRNPDRFPPRNGRVSDEDRMELWCYRIVAGRATVEEVANLFGVNNETVRIRVRNVKARLARRAGASA